jgi:hypothetical protein
VGSGASASPSADPAFLEWINETGLSDASGLRRESLVILFRLKFRITTLQMSSQASLVKLGIDADQAKLLRDLLDQQSAAISKEDKRCASREEMAQVLSRLGVSDDATLLS